MADSVFPHEIMVNDRQHAKELMHVLVNAGCSFEYDGAAGFGGTLRVGDDGREVLGR